MSEPRYLDLSYEPVLKRRRKLPHWEADGVAYFFTFRLADSMPKAIADRGREYKRILERVRLTGSHEDVQRAERDLFRFAEGHLDRGYGSCCLKDASAAAIVWDALHFTLGTRYDLYAACVMPNHVHAVFRAIPPERLSTICHSWKSFTATECNKSLGRSGRLWEPESFDHVVRSPGALRRFVRYVLMNPVKARLNDWPWVATMLDEA